MVCLVDANIIFDVVTQEAKWFDWSFEKITDQRNRCFLNPIIYSDLCCPANSCFLKRFKELERTLKWASVRISLCWNTIRAGLPRIKSVASRSWRPGWVAAGCMAKSGLIKKKSLRPLFLA